ncbi:hypothetical protein MRY87_04990 [bacterium]|nr:hypothetical protein [bacterium]
MKRTALLFFPLLALFSCAELQEGSGRVLDNGNSAVRSTTTPVDRYGNTPIERSAGQVLENAREAIDDVRRNAWRDSEDQELGEPESSGEEELPEEELRAEEASTPPVFRERTL